TRTPPACAPDRAGSGAFSDRCVKRAVLPAWRTYARDVSAQGQPQVIADVHERQSGIPQALEDLAVEVTIAPLRAGDYAIGSDVLVERKSVLGLHGSIEQGRFWPQIGRLRYESRVPFLLVEGDNIDAGPLSPKAIRGACIAVINRGIRLIGNDWRVKQRLRV